MALANMHNIDIYFSIINTSEFVYMPCPCEALKKFVGFEINLTGSCHPSIVNSSCWKRSDEAIIFDEKNIWSDDQNLNQAMI